jgi:TonB-dependent SusC/RagA subfamily outer membrane receptor
MLRGQPGVLVNGRSVIIQGISTIYGSTEPLYVLDGAIVSTIDGIPPQMVKSIEILKGPSASIYGSRGANGVILVTLLKVKK